jgi:hypothetical protein
MARRTKKRVKNRARIHRDRVRKAHTKRLRARSRGFHPATKKRRVRAARRAKRVK